MTTRTLSPDAMPSDPSPDDARLLFCPFCRECYEGETSCPEHELPLVDFSELPRQAHERRLAGWEEDLDPWDPRFGRGFLAAGAALTGLGFFLPFASGVFDDDPMAWTGLDLATGPARILWTVPFVVAVYVYLLVRRRTPLQMLGARLVAVLLAFMPPLSVGYSMWAMNNGLELLHGGGVLYWGAGPWAIFAGSALLLVGGVRFGVVPIDTYPHGAEPEDEELPSIDTSDEAPRRRKKRRRR